MPRGSYTSVIASTTDEEFRAWGVQLSNLLKSVLTQTSDTGQIDWARGATVTDNFNRADGAVGGIWTNHQGTANVESNKLRMSGTPNGAAISFNAGTGAVNSHGKIRVTIGSTGADGNPSLVWRASSLGGINGFVWDPTAGTIRSITGLNTFSAMATHTPITLAPGDVLEVEFHGSSSGASNHEYYCRRNGVLIASGTQAGGSSNSTSNFHGLRTFSHATGALLEDFEYYTPLKQYPANTMAGYEMYRFSDSLQSTKPVFLKIEYGSASQNSSAGIRLSVGTATNGAGTLTALTWTGGIKNGSAHGGVSSSSYACYKNGCFTLAWGILGTAGGYSAVFGVDRSRDATGASTGNGLLAFCAMAGSAPAVGHFQFDLAAAVTTVTGPGVPCLMPSGTVSATEPVCNVFNWFILTPDLFNITGWFSYKTAEITPGAEVDIALCGSTDRHYLCLGLNAVAGASHTGNTSNDTMAILWEA